MLPECVCGGRWGEEEEVTLWTTAGSSECGGGVGWLGMVRWWGGWTAENQETAVNVQSNVPLWNFREAVTVLLICLFVFPCGLVGVCWVTVNIGAPAVRKLTLLSVWQVSVELWKHYKITERAVHDKRIWSQITKTLLQNVVPSVLCLLPISLASAMFVPLAGWPTASTTRCQVGSPNFITL